MDIPIKIGNRFSSFDEVQKVIGDYEKKFFVNLWKNDCKKVDGARFKHRNLKQELVYAEIKYSCALGGRAYTSKPTTGERPNQKTSKIGCPFEIRFKPSQDGQFLEVSKIVDKHNHPITEASFKYHPKQRKLDSDALQEAAYLLRHDCPKRNVLDTLSDKTGQRLVMKDIHNIATNRANSDPDNNPDDNVKQLAQWIEQTYPHLDTEFVINEQDVLTGLFMQDSEMKSTFERFPEVSLTLS